MNQYKLCPSCGFDGNLKYPEKIDSKKITKLTYASRKLPELMHYDLFECSNCKTLFTKKDVKIEELLQNYEDADYDSNVEAIFAAKTYVQNLQKALPKFRGDVFDIGAGDGAFLSEAKKFFADKAVGNHLIVGRLNYL